MNYTVLWLPDAENELAAVWMASADRAAVTTASTELDRRMAADPENEGESRVGSRRITFEKPLAIYFDVDTVRRRVQVVRVWEFR
ncbi:MAG: hypothetical protein ABGY75_18345 [Gemmataceae bacterium]